MRCLFRGNNQTAEKSLSAEKTKKGMAEKIAENFVHRKKAFLIAKMIFP